MSGHYALESVTPNPINFGETVELKMDKGTGSTGIRTKYYTINGQQFYNTDETSRNFTFVADEAGPMVVTFYFASTSGRFAGQIRASTPYTVNVNPCPTACPNPWEGQTDKSCTCITKCDKTQIWNKLTKMCDANPNPPTDTTDKPGCPPGLHKDANGTCIANVCDDGFKLDGSGNCVPVVNNNVCDAGYHIENGQCVKNPPINCPEGFKLNDAGTSCDSDCPPGQNLDDVGNCVNDSITCPTGTYEQDGACEAIPTSLNCVAGLYDNGSGTCVPIPGYTSGSTVTTNTLPGQYQQAQTYTDVFKTPETDTKSDSTNYLLYGGIGIGVIGIGGIIYYQYFRR